MSKPIKINWKQQQQAVERYMEVLQSRESQDIEITDIKFLSLDSIFTAMTKVKESKGSKESKLFWYKLLDKFTRLISFAENQDKENRDLFVVQNKYYELSKSLMDELNSVKSENTRLIEENLKIKEMYLSK